jgi:uncharacterized protein (DUF1697 family)
MIKYVAFLRGINVGGKNKIKMSDIKDLFESLSFKNVSTYLQSGNVVFDNENNHPELISKKVENKIFHDLNLSIPIILRTHSQLKKIIINNPFLNNRIEDDDSIYVTFLNEKPNKQIIEKIQVIKSEPHEFIVSDKEIYLFCPYGYGKTKLNNNFFENKFKISATTRNWKTLKYLVKNF